MISQIFNIINKIFSIISTIIYIFFILFIISLFYSLINFGHKIDKTLLNFINDNKDFDKEFKTKLYSFYKYTNSVINDVFPTLPSLNSNISVPQNLAKIIPQIPYINIDKNIIPCPLDNLKIFIPDPLKAAQCAGEKALEAAKATLEGMKKTAEAAEYTYNKANAAYNSATSAAQSAVNAYNNAVADTARQAQIAIDNVNAVANQALSVANDSLNIAFDTAGSALTSLSYVFSMDKHFSNIGSSFINFANDVVSSFNPANWFGGNNYNKSSLQKGGGHKKEQIWAYLYHRIVAIEKYLLETDINIKIQYAKNPKTKILFDKHEFLAGNEISFMAHYWLGWRHPTNIIINVIYAKMGRIWNPLERPYFKKAIEHGILDAKLLHDLFYNTPRAKNKIDSHINSINAKRNEITQNVRNSRRTIETQLQNTATNLNNIANQKFITKNNTYNNYITAKQNYDKALSNYNKQLQNFNNNYN